MTLLRTRQGVIDLDALAAWNVRQEACRVEYDRDPLALARFLGDVDSICGRCSRSAHKLCSGRVGQQRANPRLCVCERGAHQARRV